MFFVLFLTYISARIFPFEQETKCRCKIVAVTLLLDESEYGMPMPEERAEVLATDEDAWERFPQLTPGRQRNILYMVGSAKREETRINRALLIAEHLKMGARDPGSL